MIPPRIALAFALALGLACGSLGPVQAQAIGQWEELAIDGVEAFQLGDYDLAAERFGRALAAARDSGATDQRITNSLINLARTFRVQRRLAEAEPLYREVIARQEAAHGIDDPDLALSLEALGGIYAAQAQWAAAEPVLRRALRILERTVGSEHPYTAVVVADLGDVALGTDRNIEAVGLFARVVAIRTKYYGADHRSLAAPLTREGIALRALKRNDDARDVFIEAWAIWQRESALPGEVTLTLRNLIEVERQTGHYEAAVQHGRELIAHRADEVGPDTLEFAAELDDFARTLQLAGDPSQAQAMADWAAAIRAAGGVRGP